jgi:hypothetical protein
MKAPRIIIAVALAALVCAAPALAHGWPPPVGGGTPSFSGPAGGGGDTTPAGGGGGTPPSTATGGGDPNAGNTTGGTARPTPSTAGGNTTLSRGGGAAAPTKAKGGTTPWMAKAKITWVPAFLPTIAQNGYAARTATVADGVRLPQSEGGWARDQRPVMVFSYDATNAEHRRLLSTLDGDARVRNASYLFNCFRVDVGAADRKEASDARLSVFTKDGTLVGEVTGQRKLNAVYDLLETAWKKDGGSDLTNRIAKVDGVVKTKAYCEHFIPLCEAGIVCPDCGHERLDILERIAELRARAEACDRALDELRVIAKN